MIDGTMTREQSDAVYDILVAVCYAPDGDLARSSFADMMAQGCSEYRFCGTFGFGGKFWIGDFAVNYYQEDATSGLDRIQDEANAKLAALRQSWVDAKMLFSLSLDELVAEVTGRHGVVPERPRAEKLTIVRFLVVFLSAKSLAFEADPFIEECGFKPSDVYNAQ